MVVTIEQVLTLVLLATLTKIFQNIYYWPILSIHNFIKGLKLL